VLVTNWSATNQALREGGEVVPCAGPSRSGIAALPRLEWLGAPSLFSPSISTSATGRAAGVRQQQRHPNRGDTASVHHAEPPQREHCASAGGRSEASAHAGGRNGGLLVTSAPSGQPGRPAKPPGPVVRIVGRSTGRGHRRGQTNATIRPRRTFDRGGR
jgi:hypothetical protein